MPYFGELIDPCVVQDKRNPERYGLPIAGIPFFDEEGDGILYVSWADGTTEHMLFSQEERLITHVPTYNQPSTHNRPS